MSFFTSVLRNLILLTFLLGAFSDDAFASLCNTEDETDPRNEIQLLAGYSPKASTLIGTTEGRRFLQAGVAYSYRCWRAGQTGISYTGTFLPLAMIFQPRHSIGSGSAMQEIPAHAVYGISALPLGFTFDFGHQRSWNVYAETHGGIIASTERVPIDDSDATGLNFTFDFGGGVRWSVGERNALRAGYRFVHISNAATTPFNPGLDNNVLYLGWSFLR